MLSKTLQVIIAFDNQSFIVCLQVTTSFKLLTQAQPDLTMTFVSEVAKKMGLPHRQSEAAVIDSDDEQAEYSQDAEFLTADSPESSSKMDVDSSRRRR